MPTFYAPTSVKERILEDLKSTLQNIKIASGYSIDVKRVERFRLAGWQTLEFPTLMVVGVKESKRAIEGNPSRMEVTMNVEIQCIFTQHPVDDTEQAHNLILKDIEAAIQQDVQRGTYGVDSQPNAVETTVDGTDFDVVQAESPYCISTLTARILFRHGRKDPTRAY